MLPRRARHPCAARAANHVHLDVHALTSVERRQFTYPQLAKQSWASS